MQAIDWTHVATTAVGILVPLIPYLKKLGEKAAEQLGEKVTEAAWEKGKAIWRVIKDWFDRDEDPKGKTTAEMFLEDPETFEVALVKLVAKKAKADPEFGRVLQELVQKSVQDEGVVQFLNNFYPGSTVEKFVQMGTVYGNVHI